MTDSTKIRSAQWEDDTPLEPRIRRAQSVVPPDGRQLPGMPIDIEDVDVADGLRPAVRRRKSSVRYGRSRWSTFLRWLQLMAALLLLAALVVGIYFAHLFLSRDSRFRIASSSNIEVSGTAEVSRSEVLPIFGEDIGRNIFFIPLAERRRQLEQLPWVEHATVMRILPAQIHVQIVERQPVAFARQGQQFGLVDADGVLLTMPATLMAQHHYSFPTLSGINPAEPLAARRQRMELYLRLLHDLDAGGQHVSSQISEVDLSDPEDARVTMQADTTLLHFGEDHFVERYQNYRENIAQLHQQYPNLEAIDLRYEQQVVLSMASKPAADTTTDQKTPDSKSDSKPDSKSDSKPAAKADTKSAPRSATHSAAHDKGHDKKTAHKPDTKHRDAHSAPHHSTAQQDERR